MDERLLGKAFRAQFRFGVCGLGRGGFRGREDRMGYFGQGNVMAVMLCGVRMASLYGHEYEAEM